MDRSVKCQQVTSYETRPSNFVDVSPNVHSGLPELSLLKGAEIEVQRNESAKLLVTYLPIGACVNSCAEGILIYR